MEGQLDKKVKGLSEVNEKTYIPPVALRRFCMTLLSGECMGSKEKAMALSGIDKGKFYYAFRTSVDFRKWYSEQCDLFINSNEGLISSALLRACLQGEVSAIRTFYEMKQKIKQPVNSKNGNRPVVPSEPITIHLHYDHDSPHKDTPIDLPGCIVKTEGETKVITI